jgi:hypothetical protein
LRNFSDEPGIVAIARIDPDTGQEVVAVYNTSATRQRGNVIVARGTTRFSALDGPCPAAPRVSGSMAVDLPAFGWMICAGEGAQ